MSRPNAVYVMLMWSLCPWNAGAGPKRMLYAASWPNGRFSPQPLRPNTYPAE
ncbi:hypothetical protein [Kribbella catacumbae]|uniref:hypothetical protein n=1 Tax=Kribbella catacumbae TaxID=460086 RepID=UPI00037AC17B|nr:hypothetical protein [Kribbella catacumbae]